MIDNNQFREYLTRRNLKGISIDSYLRDTEQFCAYIEESGITGIDQVSVTDINRYCEYMYKKGLAEVSIQRKLASIKRLFEFLCECGQARCNPADGIHIRKRTQEKARILTDEQMKQLLLMPDARNIGGIRDKAMFMLICETGIKVSELVSLRVDDLRLKEKCVLIRRQDLMLKVEINEEVCRCLRAYLASRELFYPKTSDMLLFLNVYGRTITRQGVWKTLKKYADHADMKGITLETLRRSFAHRFLDSGKDIRSLRKILGHSDVAITRAYVKG